jgi:hypothetical protein
MTATLRDSSIAYLDADPIFFSKHRLRHGTLLRCHGRRSNGALWYVDRIVTKKKGETVIFPTALHDLVRLRNGMNNGIVWRTFGYLSYSAIWRIET